MIQKNELEIQQETQERQYSYPYHFIPVLDQGKKLFSQVQYINWGYEYVSYLYFIIRELAKYEFQELLDVGCGDGRFIFELEKKFPGKKFVGIDYSPRAIRIARSMCYRSEFFCADVTDPEAISGKFDIVTLIETLEHIPPDQIRGFIGALRLRLAEHGKFILSVPSKNIRTSKKHFQHFDLQDLNDAIGHLFRIDKCYYTNKRSYVVRRLRKLFCNKLFVINNRWACWQFYRLYERYFFHANETTAKRIILFCAPV